MTMETITAPKSNNAFELKCINTIRVVSAEQPGAAGSGHPGAPMGCAPMAHLLWSEVMNYSPSNPKWWNRDRFVLSNGHGCALQYTMLHLTGYGLEIDDLKQFRQIHSKTPGHPENFVTKGVEVSTGPLGQGICNAVGLAIAQKHLAATFNMPQIDLFDHHIYAICGDGCLQEGVSSEACSLAGHLGLGRLIILYDDNKITIDGSTDLSFSEDVNKRYESYDWHVQTVDCVEGSLETLRRAVSTAKAVTDKPSIIKIRTTIGYGSVLQGTAATHGAPLKADDLAQVKKQFELNPEPFNVPSDVKFFYDERVKVVEQKRTEWDSKWTLYQSAHPALAAELERRMEGRITEEVLDALPKFDYSTDGAKAGRQHSQACLAAVAPLLPELMGGSADLTPSNLTKLACAGDFQKNTPEGRYMRFGVREHGMAAICNGLFAYGGIRPFCATFLNFAGYAMGSIRLSAISRFGVLYIMTHDSIGLGEDGPTHQPVEIVESMRSMPNINVFRPADSNECTAAYRTALLNHETPTVICCSRSALPKLEHSTVAGAMKGAYTVIGSKIPLEDVDLILIGTGSEVGPCVEAAAKLWVDSAIKVRVVSMPCQDIFVQESIYYQRSVLPGNIPTMSVEALAVHGWHRFSHAQIGMTRFGASGKPGDLFKYFGFSVENITNKGRKLFQFYSEAGTVPNLMSRPSPTSIGTQLDKLKCLTTIVCDTGDVDAIKMIKPQDATTNPSLIFKAATMTKYAGLVEDAITFGRGNLSLVMDKLAVNFGIEITKIVPGYVSTEVDARLSYEKEATIEKGRSIIALYKEAGIDKSRILIKIAATWEGIQAAEVLEKEGITCNLTLVFCKAQAIACAEAGCTLISPFVGRIMDWYKKNDGVTGYRPAKDPGVMSVTEIYNYYKKFGHKTIIMGASFRNKEEILELAGCDRLTMSPDLLQELSNSQYPVPRKLDATKSGCMDIEKVEMNEKKFLWMLNEDPMATSKLAEGISNFAADIVRLEDVVKPRVDAWMRKS